MNFDFFFFLDEAEEFNNEWRNKAQNSTNSHRNRYLPYTQK